MPPVMQNPYQLPASAAAVIPQELGQDFLTSLDQSLQLQEKKATEDIFGQMESRGLFNSGETRRQIVDKVLGPGLQRRQQALTGLALQGAQTGEQQRFQTGFQQMQNQETELLQKRQFDFQLKAMQEQAQLNGELARLQRQLSHGSFGQNFMDVFPGMLAGGVATAATGGASAALGAGAGILESLFSSSPDTSNATFGTNAAGETGWSDIIGG